MNVLALIDRVKQLEGKHRVVVLKPGTCNALFYDEVNRGNIHNGKIRISKGGTITGFHMDNVFIEENEHYHDIQMTIETLNEGMVKATDKYVYSGQSHHSLAYAYYTNNYDKKIISICSPQLYDILTSKACMNSPFLEFYREQGETAYDKNKQYTHILMNCDEYGWCKFMPTDEVKPFDGSIDTGLYFVSTTNYRPLRGNGWYFDDCVEKA